MPGLSCRAQRGARRNTHKQTQTPHLPTTHPTLSLLRLANSFDFQSHDKPTTMAASRKTPAPAPAQSGAKQEHFDITTYARLHAQANLLVTADTRLKQVVDKIR